MKTFLRSLTLLIAVLIVGVGGEILIVLCMNHQPTNWRIAIAVLGALLVLLWIYRKGDE